MGTVEFASNKRINAKWLCVNNCWSSASGEMSQVLKISISLVRGRKPKGPGAEIESYPDANGEENVIGRIFINFGRKPDPFLARFLFPYGGISLGSWSILIKFVMNLLCGINFRSWFSSKIRSENRRKNRRQSIYGRKCEWKLTLDQYEIVQAAAIDKPQPSKGWALFPVYSMFRIICRINSLK